MSEDSASSGRFGDVWTFGFGTTLAMWSVGYVSRLPPAWISNRILFVLLLACVLGGGFLAGRHSPRGRLAGFYSGLVAGALNLLILGGLLTEGQPAGAAPSALMWVPGSVIFTAVLSTLGSLAGARFRGHEPGPRSWTGALCIVVAATCLLLLVTGGLVTGLEAGLAVPDWPNTYGSFMFLYPLSRMTGGVYYEHTHRLYGTLVGLAVVVLTLYLWRADRRRWIHGLSLLALFMVVVQGILGGLRVTGRPTFSQAAVDLAPSISLAVLHGVFGQIIFCILVSLAVVTTRTWKSDLRAVEAGSAATDQKLSRVLIAALLVQLALGALVRHIYMGVMIHVTVAVGVLILGAVAGLRAWGLEHSPALLGRTGKILLILLGAQLLLGFGALIVSGSLGGLVYDMRIQVPITSAHQILGALLLALAVVLTLWNHRLLERPGAES